ncbi:MAG: hypothetical protein ACRDVG_02490 [Jatrophihabitantaceae bacterium]
MTEALDAGSVTKLGVGIIIALIVIGLILSAVITALVARIIIAIAVVVLAFVVWQQRSSIEHKIDQRKCNLVFFGVHLDPPSSLTRCKT